MGNLIAEKQQQHKNAGKETDIIVGQDGKAEGHGIQTHFPFLQQCQGTEGNQGQQGEGIQPHDIPLITQRPGAQGVKAAEHGNRQIAPAEAALQEQGKKQAGKAQLHRHQQGEILQQPTFRYHDAEQIQRRGQIIGDETQIIHTQTHAPAVEQRVTAAQGAAEGNKKRIVLMVHIRIEHGILAEGLIPADEHHHQHSHERKSERQNQRIPLRFFHI